jgi:hypothetical protein
MAFAFFPIGSVGLSTIQGTPGYWVKLPVGSKPIRDIYTDGAPAATDGKGAVMMALETNYSIVLEDCEDAWNEDVPSGITVLVDAVDKTVGLNSVELTIADGESAGAILSEAISPAISLLGYTHIEFWIKSSVNTAAGNFQILLDNDAKCVSPLETLNVPALTAGSWTHVRLTLANPGLDISIASIGIKYAVDIGACVVNIDDFKATHTVTKFTPLTISDFVKDDVYFRLSSAIDSAYYGDAAMLVYYTSPDEDPTCSN